jgi:hypothetical protein
MILADTPTFFYAISLIKIGDARGDATEANTGTAAVKMQPQTLLSKSKYIAIIPIMPGQNCAR